MARDGICILQLVMEPKLLNGLKMVLEECGVSTAGKGANWMRETLAKHSDFRDGKSTIECMLSERAHIPCFLPKFHPQLRGCGLS